MSNLPVAATSRPSASLDEVAAPPASQRRAPATGRRPEPRGTLDALPDDVLRPVLQHLPSYTLQDLGGLNRAWGALCADRGLRGNQVSHSAPLPAGVKTRGEAGRYSVNPYNAARAREVGSLMRPTTWTGSATRAVELAADATTVAAFAASFVLPLIGITLNVQQRGWLSTEMTAAEAALGFSTLPLWLAASGMMAVADALHRRRCAALGLAPRG